MSQTQYKAMENLEMKKRIRQEIHSILTEYEGITAERNELKLEIRIRVLDVLDRHGAKDGTPVEVFFDEDDFVVVRVGTMVIN